MTNSSELRFRFTLFLAVWLAAVGMGASLSHAHLLGGQPHTHGLGWFAASCQRLPVGSSSSTNAPHRHLLLLGLELAGESTPDATGIGPAVDVTGIAAPDADVLELPAEVAVLSFEVTTFLPVVSPATDSAAEAPAVRLCHFARRALTGVLRS